MRTRKLLTRDRELRLRLKEKHLRPELLHPKCLPPERTLLTLMLLHLMWVRSDFLAYMRLN